VNRARRLARLLNILAAIVAEPGLNPLELAERAGVSERTLRRDLTQLRELGYEVAYTSGYEVQEKLNLEGRARARPPKRAYDQQLELLQAVALAVGGAGLGEAGSKPLRAQLGDSGVDGKERTGLPTAWGGGPRRRRGPEGTRGGATPTKSQPIVLIPAGATDADFIYATGFAVETGLYIRFAKDDDVLVVSPLEIDRARAQSKVANVVEDREAYAHKSWARLAAKMLREKGMDEARVSPRLPAAHLEDLRAEGIATAVDRELFLAERRHKSAAEAEAIQASQRAAEAAVVEVVRQLAAADIKDGMLWSDGGALTSERLYARAQLVLGEMGFTCPEMIIAGSPESALPHFRGEGPIRASAPVIIDIFPVGRSSHYHGDLTRTVVVGDIPEEFQRMHAATLQALDAGVESIRAGVPGKDVHLAVCQVLVDRGYGTTSVGYEGPEGVAKMNHSTGHGVGLDVHEEPSLRQTSHEPLREGDVVTVEPGLYKLGLGGVRIEDTGIVTANGFHNFTTITRSLNPKDYL
jgi:Xaa-Pro aminopeptidase